jgi:hypothetical protein
MVLQELLKNILKQPKLTIPALIKAGEQAGIYFLFNQAANGRISGITYFHEDFKIKGQALGKQFKWTELAKKIKYEQIRDSKAISEANSRTRAIYGESGATSAISAADGRPAGQGSEKFNEHPVSDPIRHDEQPADFDRDKVAAGTDDAADQQDFERTWSSGQDADLLDLGTGSNQYFDHIFDGGFEISDDIDDEAINGRNRQRKRQARTNQR